MKMPAGIFFFGRNWSADSKMYMKEQSTYTSQTIFFSLKKNEVGGRIEPNFKISYKATVIEAVAYERKDRYIDDLSKKKANRGIYLLTQVLEGQEE